MLAEILSVDIFELQRQSNTPDAEVTPMVTWISLGTIRGTWGSAFTQSARRATQNDENVEAVVASLRTDATSSKLSSAWGVSEWGTSPWGLTVSGLSGKVQVGDRLIGHEATWQVLHVRPTVVHYRFFLKQVA